MQPSLDEFDLPDRDVSQPDEQRITLPGPPGYPRVIALEEPELANPADLQREPGPWPKDLRDRAYLAPRLPRWPGIVAFVLAGAVAIAAAGTAARYRRSASTPILALVPQAKQQPMAAAPPGPALAAAESHPPPAVERPAPTLPVEQVAEARRPSTAAAPAKPTRAAGRALRGKPVSAQRAPTPERGIPVNQIYVNGRGELVDAQGRPLRLDG
jgi:hypothetical protein